MSCLEKTAVAMLICVGGEIGCQRFAADSYNVFLWQLQCH